MSLNLGPRPSILRASLVGLLGGGTAWIGGFLVFALLRGLIEPLGQPTGRWAGLIVLCSVTFGVAVRVARWIGARGMLAAAIAGLTNSGLLLSMILSADDGDSFNPLIFGWAGLLCIACLALAGGWVGHRWWQRTGDRPGGQPQVRPETSLAMTAVGMWLACEFVIRLYGVTSVAGLVGSRVGGDMLATLALLPVAVHWMMKYAHRQGITQADLGYRHDRQAVIAGLAGGAVMLGAVFLTAPIDAWLFAAPAPGGVAPAPSAAPALPVEAVWVAGLLLLVNDIVVPICEERVWRGVIQTSLVRVWGAGLGLTVTALAFSVKHMIIDGSPGRLTVIFVFGLIVGLIRTRWGTTASTVAHCVTNLAATALVLFAQAS